MFTSALRYLLNRITGAAELINSLTLLTAAGSWKQVLSLGNFSWLCFSMFVFVLAQAGGKKDVRFKRALQAILKALRNASYLCVNPLTYLKATRFT